MTTRPSQRWNPKVEGAVANLGPLVLVLLGELWDLSLDHQLWTTALVLSVCVSLTALLSISQPRLARWILALALSGCLGLAILPLLGSPHLVLLTSLSTGGLVAWVWAARREPGPGKSLAAARGAAGTGMLTWFMISLEQIGTAGINKPALLVSGAICIAVGFLAVRKKQPESPLFRSLLNAVLGMGVVLGLFELLGVTDWFWGALLCPFGILLLGREPIKDRTSWMSQKLLGQPARILVTTFATMILVGTLLLSLPLSSSNGRALSLLDAAFTAVSAVCVTGLVVQDTGSAFSPWGQGAILVLIQLGGLGIMSFSVAAFGLIGKRMSFRYEFAVTDMLAIQHRRTLGNALSWIFGITFGAELLGAAVLSAAFLERGDSLGMALWRGLFTAVSAFCNAGFALQADSLVSYQSSPLILHTVALLIVLGGLSPMTVLAFGRLWRGQRISIQNRLALLGSGILILLGFFAFIATEWEGVLSGMPISERLSNSLFQSITLRTAGFNSVPMDVIAPASLSWMMVWMFLGGCPGGTAGGIKITTAAVLILAVIGTARGRAEAEIFGRRIPHEAVYKAAALFTGGVGIVGLVTIILLLTQSVRGDLLIFETVSALGTVGLSMGATPLLDGVGKILIMICMFAGRLGPLTLFIFLAGRPGGPPWELPPENVEVG